MKAIDHNYQENIRGIILEIRFLLKIARITFVSCYYVVRNNNKMALTYFEIKRK